MDIFSLVWLLTAMVDNLSLFYKLYVACLSPFYNSYVDTLSLVPTLCLFIPLHGRRFFSTVLAHLEGGKFFSIYGGVFFSNTWILLDFFYNFCNNREKDATFTFPSIYLEKILPPFYFILVGFECVTRFLITKEELTHIEINTPRLWLFRHRDYLQF